MTEYIELLKREVKPAFGCTEPIALAFAAAKAAELLGVRPDHIHGRLSGNIIKNAKSVTIPNSEGRTGIYYSLILGTLVGTAAKELEVLEKEKMDTEKQIAEKSRYIKRIPKYVGGTLMWPVPTSNSTKWITAFFGAGASQGYPRK